MRNIALLTTLTLTALLANAQITLENTYPLRSLPLIKLERAGYKWCLSSYGTGFTLYNLDHTVYKQVSLPTLPSSTNSIKISFITETLFDTDSSDIEYAVSYDNGGGFFAFNSFRVFDEAGNTVFAKDSAAPVISIPGDISDYTYPTYIYNTPSGAKMVLSNGSITLGTPVSYVYSLPGLLECGICDGQQSGGLGWFSPEQQFGFSVSPNPTNSFSLVKYELPDDVNEASLIIYDALGAEKRRYTINRQSSQLMLPVTEFPAGTYFYTIDIPGRSISAKKMIVVH